jgi:hypothetical protein
MTPIEFGGFEQSRTIWEAAQDDSENEALLMAQKSGGYLLVINDDTDARLIALSRDQALGLIRSIEDVEQQQDTLF